ncbi:MAG: dioxygenase [Magnetococcales bacterium]|nr:dioxygenase [Magnetococcales bacterium]NGZ27965.1 dioxygenase [Magnetococcales bacterium]
MKVVGKQETWMDPLFVSHGAPDLILRDHPCRHFLENLGRTLPRPRGIVVVSGHWESATAKVTRVGRLETVHDFFGFPRELYEIDYPAQGEAWLVESVISALGLGKVANEQVSDRGLDHGAWVPLRLMFPDAQIPVVQLSLLQRLDPLEHLHLGITLHPLCQQGVLILGSGAITHNLRRLNRPGTPPEPWSSSFSQWLHQQLTGEHPTALARGLAQAPHLALAHPTLEHLMPLFVVLGAAGDMPVAERIHDSFDYGSLNLAAYRFKSMEG